MPGRARGARWRPGRAAHPDRRQVRWPAARRTRVDDARQVLVDGGPADAQLPGDARDGVLRPEQQLPYLAELLLGERGRPPEPLTAGAGGGKAVACPRRDGGPAEFGEPVEHPEDRVAAGTGGVKFLAQRPQPGAPPPDLRDGGDQFALRPPELVKARHHERVTGPEGLQAVAQPRPPGVPARRLVGVDPRAPGVQGQSKTALRRLRVVARYARVPDQPPASWFGFLSRAGPCVPVLAAHVF